MAPGVLPRQRVHVVAVPGDEGDVGAVGEQVADEGKAEPEVPPVMATRRPCERIGVVRTRE